MIGHDVRNRSTKSQADGLIVSAAARLPNVSLPSLSPIGVNDRRITLK